MIHQLKQSVLSFGKYDFELFRLASRRSKDKVFEVNMLLLNELRSSSSIFIYTQNRIILHGLPRNRV